MTFETLMSVSGILGIIIGIFVSVLVLKIAIKMVTHRSISWLNSLLIIVVMFIIRLLIVLALSAVGVVVSLFV